MVQICEFVGILGIDKFVSKRNRFNMGGRGLRPIGNGQNRQSRQSVTKLQRGQTAKARHKLASFSSFFSRVEALTQSVTVTAAEPITKMYQLYARWLSHPEEIDW